MVHLVSTPAPASAPLRPSELLTAQPRLRYATAGAQVFKQDVPGPFFLLEANALNNDQTVIRVENGVVTLLEQRVLKTVSVTAFQDSLASSLGVRTPLLPVGCVLYAKQAERTCFLLEQPPGVRQVQFRDKERSRTYAIPIPYAYFAVVFHNYALEFLCTFFAPKPVQSTGTSLCYAPLPNIHRDGAVCLGDYRFRVTADVPTRVADVVRYFWESQFNQDILELYQNEMPDRIRELTPKGEPWFEGWSKVPTDLITTLAWSRCCTVAEAIDRALR
jgi:hypothetical protein